MNEKEIENNKELISKLAMFKAMHKLDVTENINISNVIDIIRLKNIALSK